MHPLSNEFIDSCAIEAPKMGRRLARHINCDAFATFLGRFDLHGDGSLSEPSRRSARRLLALLHRPSARGFEMLDRVLSYLDANTNHVTERDELELAAEILEMFCKADFINDTLSLRELEMLLAVLEHLDEDHDGHLSGEQRDDLRDALWQPDTFLAEQRANNNKLRAIIGLS